MRGLIDGYYWVRQTELYDAKGFAEHLVDIESNACKNVRIGKGVACKRAPEAIKACYALSTPPTCRPERQADPDPGLRHGVPGPVRQVTATDAGLETRGLQAPRQRTHRMNNSVDKELLLLTAALADFRNCRRRAVRWGA